MSCGIYDIPWIRCLNGKDITVGKLVRSRNTPQSLGKVGIECPVAYPAGYTTGNLIARHRVWNSELIMLYTVLQ